jgi:hypothetical protein
MLKLALTAALALLALSANAQNLSEPMEPLVAMDQKNDEDFRYYTGVINREQTFIDQGLIDGRVWIWENIFDTYGEAVWIKDGSPEYPYNLVVRAQGRLYYIDTIFTSILSDEKGTQLKLRRRWANDPAPGVFIRLEGTRFNPDIGMEEYTQLWVKIAETDGSPLRVLELFTGNYDK